MRRLICLLSILMIVNCSCQQPVVTQSDKEDFLKKYINEFHPKNLSDTLLYSNSLDDVFNLKDTALNLSESDKQFMKQQLGEEQGMLILNKTHFKNVQWKTSNRQSHINLTVPIFSKDKTIVVIYKWYWCGMLCGEGSFQVFKLENGNWVQLKLKLPLTIS